MSQPEAGPSRRRRGQYTAQACNNCRRRRCKCDGVHPICGTCSSSGHECTWDPDAEDPRPASRQYIESLRTKIQILESQIAQLKQDNHSLLPEHAPGPLPSDIIPPGVFEHTRYAGTPPTSQTPSQPNFTTAGSLSIVPLTPASADQSSAPFEPQAMYRYIFHIDTSIPFEEQSPEDQSSLSCEWNRHLPDLDNIQLSRLDHDSVLLRCFAYAPSWLAGLIPDLFLRDMARVLTPETPQPPPYQTLHYSPMLHCSLLAFALAFSDNPQLRALSTRERFATHAKQWLDQEFNHPTPNLILSLALLSECHSGAGEHLMGYMYMGMSVRATQFPGIDSHSPVRNWYHWSAFVQEKLMALDRTIPSVMSVPDVDLSIPIAVELGGRPRGATSSEALFEDPDYSKFVVDGFIQSCKLIIIATQLVDIAQPSDITIPDIRLQLDTWFNELPDGLLIRQRSNLTLPHVLSLHICFWWLMLHLYLPLLDRAPPPADSESGTNQSIKMCERATEKLTQLFVAFDKQHGIRYFPRNMLKAIYTCGCALLIERTLAPVGAVKKRTTAQEGIDTCLSALRRVADTWPCATALADELEERVTISDGSA